MFKKLLTWLLIISLSLGGIAPVKAGNVVDHYRYASASYVSSIQQFSVTVSSGNTTGTVSINAVGSNAFIIWQGFTTGQTSAGSQNSTSAYVQITSSTQITITRNSSNADSVTVKGTVFDPGASLVDSIQQGTVSITSTNTTGTATISSVDTSRSVLFYNGNLTSLTGFSNSMIGMQITSATQVTGTRGSATSGTTTGAFVIVQFKSGILNSSPQQVATQYTSTNTTDTKTITSVTTANSFIAIGGRTITTNTGSDHYYYQITAATTVTLTRALGTSNTRVPYYTVVEFASGILAQNQQGTVATSAGTSGTTTITSANTSKTIAVFTENTSTTSNSNTNAAAINQSDATTIATATNGSSTTTSGFEALTFN